MSDQNCDFRLDGIRFFSGRIVRVYYFLIRNSCPKWVRMSSNFSVLRPLYFGSCTLTFSQTRNCYCSRTGQSKVLVEVKCMGRRTEKAFKGRTDTYPAKLYNKVLFKIHFFNWTILNYGTFSRNKLNDIKIKFWNFVFNPRFFLPKLCNCGSKKFCRTAIITTTNDHHLISIVYDHRPWPCSLHLSDNMPLLRPLRKCPDVCFTFSSWHDMKPSKYINGIKQGSRRLAIEWLRKFRPRDPLWIERATLSTGGWRCGK